MSSPLFEKKTPSGAIELSNKLITHIRRVLFYMCLVLYSKNKSINQQQTIVFYC